MSNADLGISVNKTAPQDSLRQPRGFVSVNGVQVPWQYFMVSNTRYSSAGTFKVNIPASTLPKTMQLSTLASTAPLTVQINAGVPAQVISSTATPSDLPVLILGDADELVYDPKTTMITLSGRDYISRFIENKVLTKNKTNAFTGLNPGAMTSSQVVSQIATFRGLTPNVTTTDTPIGKYKNSSHSALALNLSQILEWDLMTSLAREENFDIFVSGMNLFFQEKSSSTPYQVTLTIPFYTTPGQISTSNAESVSLTRNLRLAKDISVTVSTWNHFDNLSYSATANLTHKHSTGSRSPNIGNYNYVFPDLSSDQVQQRAQNLLLQLSQHEMSVNVRMPADSLVTAHSTISVKNTNSLFDQTYFVKNVTREMDFTGGYIMNIEAKTQSPYDINVVTS